MYISVYREVVNTLHKSSSLFDGSIKEDNAYSANIPELEKTPNYELSLVFLLAASFKVYSLN